MVLKCCVALCKNNQQTPNVSLHNFTKDPELVKVWLEKIRRDIVKSRQNPRPFRLSKWTKICSVHFRRSDFLIRSEKSVLKANAVPTIFKWTDLNNGEAKDSNTETLAATAASGIASVAVIENNVSVQESVRDRDMHSNECKAEPDTELPQRGISDQSKIMSNVTESEKLEDEIEGVSERVINEVLPSCLSSSSIKSANTTESTGSLDYKTLSTLYTDLLIEQQQFVEMCKCKKTITCNKSINTDVIFQNVTEPIFSLERFKHDDNAIMYYTGFGSYAVLNISLNMLFEYSNSAFLNMNLNSETKSSDKERRTCRENEYFLVLIKLRQNFGYQHLSDLFNISVGKVCEIFTAWINFIYVRLGSLDIWAHRDILLAESSEEFRQNYPNVIGFLDATEIDIQETNSHYNEHNNTAKGLVVVDSNGSVIFASALFTGSVSDNVLLKKSGFAKTVQSQLRKGFLLSGDIFLADKNFTATELLQPVEINIPVFRTDNTEFLLNEDFHTQEISHKRIHLERAIGRIKNYKILASEVPLSLLGTFSQIWTVCCLLSNFQDPLKVRVH